jgi:hypothetical protein
VTNFIVLHLRDKKTIATKLTPPVEDITNQFTELFKENEAITAKMDFYGSDFGMSRLGYIALISVMRRKMCSIIDSLDLDEGPQPPRLDGGYGWFLVYETETADEKLDSTSIGCNEWGDENTYFFYLVIGKYYNDDVYHKHGIGWIWEQKIIDKTVNGILPDDILTDNDCVALLRNNLIFKDGNKYKFNFPIFDNIKQWDDFFKLFYGLGDQFDGVLTEIVLNIYKSFKSFVPKHIAESEIKQRVKNYSYNIIALSPTS